MLPTTSISSNKLGLNGMQTLAECLPHTKIIELNLSRNLFGVEAIGYLATFLPQTKIERLNIGNNNFRFLLNIEKICSCVYISCV